MPYYIRLLTFVVFRMFFFFSSFIIFFRFFWWCLLMSVACKSNCATCVARKRQWLDMWQHAITVRQKWFCYGVLRVPPLYILPPPPRDGRDTEAPIQWPSLSLKRRRSSRVHSMCWRAQSLWRHAHGMEGRYTPALDMWSVGCILAELLTLEGNPKNKKYVIWNAILVLVRVIRASYLMTQPSLRTWWLIFHTNPSTSDTSFVPDDSSFHTYMITSYDSINDPPNKLLPPLAI